MPQPNNDGAIEVLDHGYIKLIGTMISESDDKACAQSLDEMVVEAARVSYGGGMKGEEKDRKLLHYLMEHEHGTPFEMVTFKFEVKCPMFIGEQWLRHRWSSFNKISGRYTEEVAVEYYTPEKFRGQDIKNKQGSVDKDLGKEPTTAYPDETSNSPATIEELYNLAMGTQIQAYKNMVRVGVAKEIARGVLGAAFYTKFVWSVNARSLMNFLILRCESHAQWEIRQYANVLLTIFKEKMPWTADSMVRLFPTSFTDISVKDRTYGHDPHATS